MPKRSRRGVLALAAIGPVVAVFYVALAWMESPVAAIGLALVACAATAVLGKTIYDAVTQPVPVDEEQAQTGLGKSALQAASVVALIVVVVVLRAASARQAPAPSAGEIEPLEGVTIDRRMTIEADGRETLHLIAAGAGIRQQLRKLELESAIAARVVRNRPTANGDIIVWLPSEEDNADNRALVREAEIALERRLASTPGRAPHLVIRFGVEATK